MSAETLERRTAPERSNRPSPVRLTTIELRKLVDTRSGLWLLIVIGLLAALLVAVQLIWGDESNGTFVGLLGQTLLPVAILLPVLGILTVTTEWSQRTALTTFTLVPQRSRILGAKLAAAVVLGLAALLVCLMVSAVGTVLASAFDRGSGSWSLTAPQLAQPALLLVLNVVMGVAFGMLLLNTPVAIVTYFVLPTIFTVLGATITSIAGAITWLDVNTAMDPLFDGTTTGKDWQHLTTSGIIFIAIPLVVGGWRLLRSEVK